MTDPNTPAALRPGASHDRPGIEGEGATSRITEHPQGRLGEIIFRAASEVGA